MRQKKWLKREAEEYIRVLAIFIAAVVAALVTFFVAERRAAEVHVQDRLIKNVVNQSYLLNLVLEQNYDYLEAVADHVGADGSLCSDDSLNMISALEERTILERILLADERGNALYNDGARSHVGDRRYFAEAISGKRTLSDPLASRVDGESRIILGVPVRSEGRIIGILGGSLNVTKLSQLLFEDVYDGSGTALLTMEDGGIVSLDCGEDCKDLQEAENALEHFAAMEFERGDSYEELENGFAKQRVGCVKLGKPGSGGEQKYLSYAPLGINGWMVGYLVPESAAQKNYAFIRQYESYLSIALVVFVLILIRLLFRLNSKKQEELMVYARTDALTGAVNKQSTEDQIETYLAEEGKDGFHAFLMLDIDHFKEINDHYGHGTGDEVLRHFGNILRGQFRSDDIIGRIGGDEFVVFMKRVDSPENAAAKAEKICRILREIRLAGMAEPIASSMGLAFFPEHGTHYQELYRNADTALYQTKQRGRNGYTVYGGGGKSPKPRTKRNRQ